MEHGNVGGINGLVEWKLGIRKESLAGGLAFQLYSRRGRCRAMSTGWVSIGAAGAPQRAQPQLGRHCGVEERPAQSYTAALALFTSRLSSLGESHRVCALGRLQGLQSLTWETQDPGA